MAANYRPSNYSPNAHAIAFERMGADRFALKCAGDDIKDLYDKLALLLKDVESTAADEALMALEHHAAALRVAAEEGL